MGRQRSAFVSVNPGHSGSFCAYSKTSGAGPLLELERTIAPKGAGSRISICLAS